MGSMSADTGSWPSPVEIQRLLEERSTEELEAIAPEGVTGLCKRLGSDPQDGLPSNVPDRHKRVEVYGENALAEKTMKGYLHYVWEALHDKIILLLLAIGTLELIMEMAFHPQERNKAWIEPTAIYITVLIIVNVQSSMDYSRERLFDSLSKRVAASNLRYVIRSGQQESLRDDEIVVGDILAFNAHMAASIPADGLLITGDGVKMDESALTGETEPVSKDADVPFMFGGTIVSSGQGRMLVLAVGEESVAGRIRKAVYEDDEGEPSPLFEKLDRMANAIGRLGTCAAVVVFLALCIQGFAIHREPADQVIEYLLLALGVLAVAVPEGLPLALTISLAISSNRMSYHNNLVKTLDSCETMGSVTTICTDKTGTLTANRMTVEACYIAGVLFPAEGGGAAPVGERVRGDSRLGTEVKGMVNSLICVCTMDESSVTPAEEAGGEPKYSGNPTECAMLRFSEQCGFRYQEVRRDTPGRGEGTREDGVVNAFSSSRKMMSWAVPHGSSGGYRIYVKGASEAIMARSSSALGPGGEVSALTDAERQRLQADVLSPFASSAFRTIGLAFADLPGAPDDSLHNKVTNLDGSPALACETELTLVGVLGIADPLRPEVPGAIKRCYTAGIDVRMVTGDNLDTAVAIARKAGILDEKRDFDGAGELKLYRAMEGKKFRQHVHRQTQEGERIFLQDKFDEVWPYLRVLARSSPEDKLTLARGLSGSSLYQNTDLVNYLKWHDSINVFPDRQVVAMTGDGTNDAPALKSADVGFAMGNAGTQIAKDAADIILLDDNFASIVTAANWGRNVFDSVQKFLQFQLTVNISIVTISLITAFAGLAPPLTLLHLLWVNLIMDSLASIALASEPPTEKQLQRPPVNRSQFIISEQMWYNMLGQAAYQIVVILVILGMRNIVPGCGGGTGPGSEHYTIIFNTFVLMQLFNEYNSRFLRGEWNIFQGLLRNPIFLAVSFVTFVLQVLMTQFGSSVLHLHEGGLTAAQWLFCLAVGAGPLLWQPVINLIRRATLGVSRWLHRRSRAEAQRRRTRSRTGAGGLTSRNSQRTMTYHGRSFGGGGGGQTSRFQPHRSSGVDMLV